MIIKITCLNNDQVKLRGGFWGEHGVSFLVETAGKRFLLDTGTSGEILEHNLGRLNTDLSEIDAIFLSHAHYDHTGGLEWVLSQVKEPLVIGDPQVFAPKFNYLKETDQRKLNGSFMTQAQVQNKARLQLTEEAFEIATGVWFSGQIPRENSFEKVPDYFVHEVDGQFVQDQIMDDRSMILDHPKGFILLTGCCHSGLINTLTYARQLLNKQVYAVMGGIHLTGATQERIDATITALREDFKPELMYFNHCTGEDAYIALRNEFGDKVQPCLAGMEFEF